MDQASSKDSFSSFLPQQDQNSQSSVPGSPPVSRPALSLGSNSQLTMGLINNFIQMHGLENSIVQQQLAQNSSSSAGHGQNSANQSPRTADNSQLLLEQQIKLTQLQQLQQLQNQIFQQQMALISGQSPPVLPTSTHGTSVAGEQNFSGLLTPAPSGEIRPQQPPMEFVSPRIGGYIEPLPHSMIPSSSSPQNHLHSHSPTSTVHQHMRQSSTGSINSHLQALSQQQHRSSYPPSPSSFTQQQHNDATSPIFQPTSPSHQPVSPMHLPVSSHPFAGNPHHHREMYQRQQHEFTQHHRRASQQMNPTHSHSSSTTSVSTPRSAPHSASESIAFNIYTGGPIPGLTLGPAGASIEDRVASRASSVNVAAAEAAHGSNSTNASPNHTAASNVGTGGGGLGPGFSHMQILDQDISPLTSPWLGAASQSSAVGQNHVVDISTSHRSSAVQNGSNSNKRAASESGDEGGSARKKQSPAILPVLERMTSGSRIGKEKQRENEDDRDGKNRSGRGRSSSPFGVKDSNSSKGPTQPPLTMETNLGRGVSGRSSRSPIFEGSSSSTPTASARKTRRGSKSTNSTPLLRSTPSNALGASASLTRTRSSKTRAYAQNAGAAGSSSTTATIGEDAQDSPSPVDLNLDVQHSRAMPPPPLPASSGGAGNGMGVVDLTTSPVDDGSGNSHHSMMGMGDMTFEGIMSLGGINSGGLVGMNDMGDMSGMDMTGMGMDAAMGGMGMGGIGSFGSEAMGMMGMDFGGARQGHHGSEGGQHQEQMHLHSSDGVGTKSSNQHSMQQQQQSMMPVATPRSMLNLGRLGGGRLGSSSGSGLATPGGEGVTTRAQKNSRSFSGLSRDVSDIATAVAPGKSATGSKSRRSNLVSPGLKPLRPANANTESALPSPLTGPSSSKGSNPLPNLSPTAAMVGGLSESVIRQPKRTHKDAEQRRRNSQKQVIDELRRLLPPIALPNDANMNGELDPAIMTSSSPFFFHPAAPLLPGGLPPRGPPKAGVDGPNKNVSKLQVLLCGNEYIKMLKARMERRDEEIGRLRREIKKLRRKEFDGGGGGGGGEVNGEGCEEEEEEVDLDKDLDAVERLTTAAKSSAVNNSGGSGSGAAGTLAGAAGDDVMDEDEDDDGDD